MDYELPFEVLVSAGALYAIIGLCFSVAFLTSGITRLDSRARHSSLVFRLLILPALALSWPIFAIRWVIGVTPPPIERNAHRQAALVYHRRNQSVGDNQP